VNQVTYFQALLPPPDQVSGLPDARHAPGQAEPCLALVHESLLRRTLVPLSDSLSAEMNRALDGGDQTGVLQIAYRAACDVCDTLAAANEPLAAEQGRVHVLVVELEDLEWGSAADGTLIQGGTAVQISYRNWTVDGATAVDAAAALTERWQATRPNTWMVL
jgi:hypothetical protein